MDITEVRRRFAAYGSGELDESELRSVIRRALLEEPQLSTAYIALTEAYRRANLIDEQLQSTLLADITEVTGPCPEPPISARPEPIDVEGLTILSLRSRGRERLADPEADVPSIESGASHVPALEAPAAEHERAAASAKGSRTDGPTDGTPSSTTGSTPAGTTGGSAWDTPERMSEVAVRLCPGSVLNRRFELVKELGHGGMGVVYDALDRRSDDSKDAQQHVAIKVLNDEFKRHPLAVRSLQREARKAQKLAHPNIVTVHDFDRDGGNVYMVMELLSGRSLDQLIRTEGRRGLPTARAMEIVKALGAALSHAHGQGIIHSDFKPSNAFITDEGVVKVFDFGIARAAPARVERGDKTVFDAGQLGAVSPPYASLEMLNGEEPDVRDDVYSLACVTYELLAGRHPFNRIDAAKAMDTGLEPAPLKGLKRSQWQALRQGLAFSRGARTPTVDALLAGLTERPQRRVWWAVAASCVVIAVALGTVIAREWQAHQAAVLERQLASSNAGAFQAGLQALQAAPSSVRSRVLVEESTRAALSRHFQAEIESAIAPPRFDYARARALDAELQSWLPDSSSASAIGAQLERQQRSDIGRQLVLRDQAMSRGILVASQGPDSVTVDLQNIRSIDPKDRALTDSRLPGTYATAATTALDTGRPDLAKEIVDAGLGFAPNDARLLNVADRVTTALQRATSERRIRTIEGKLAALDPAAPDYLSTLLANRDDLSTLATIDPQSAVLARVQASLQTIVQQRIKQQLSDHDIAGARNLLLDVGDLLPEQALSNARSAVMQAAQVEEDHAIDTLDRLRSAALTGRLARGGTSALDLYGELQRSGASPDVLAEARDLIAFGYLRQARRARAVGDIAAARSDLAAGIAQQPGPSLRGRLSDEEPLLSPPAAGNAPSRDTPAQLDAARERFAESLRSGTLGPGELAAMFEALDRLEALGASAQEVDSGLRNVEDRIIGEVGRVQQQSGPDSAQLLAQQASAAFPQSERIADVARQLRHSAANNVVRYSPETLADRNSLADLVARPEANDRWAAAVRRLIQRLTPLLPTNDAALADARQVAVGAFVKAASNARDSKRLPEARRYLDAARSFDPQAPAVVREAAAIEQVRAALEAEGAHQEQQAGIEALKSKLASQVAAGDMAGANDTATALRRVLGGSVYVARDIPQMLVDGYAHLARTQLAAGQVDAALQTLAAGRQKFGRAPELKNLEAQYVSVGEIYDRLRAAVTLDADEQRHMLDGLRTSVGADYPTTERMLMRTLANRIADQRAAHRETIVAKLLAAGRAIFPAYAAQLEQGKAGMLPSTGLEIGSGE